jgi:Fe-S-cluster containining protein
MKKDKSTQDENSLERQIVRGNLFTHSSIGRQAERINEIESFLYGFIDLMMKKGLLQKEELTIAAEEVRKEMYEKGELSHAGIGIRIDKSDETPDLVPVNCSERIHICKAICCKLNFALSVEEIESGKVKWDLGQPYFIRHENHGYCSHLDLVNKNCSVYNHRPAVCKKYSCANDQRIWKDFEKFELNTEWIEENLKERKIHLQGLLMIPEVKEEYNSKS